MRTPLFILLTVIVLFSSCKTQSSTTTLKARSERFLLKKIEENTINFQWFEAKIKANYKSEEDGITVSLNVRIQKDSLIWISGSKFSFEGVRMLISKDSIQVLDRTKRTYSVTDFSYISQQFNLPANFEAIQELFIGNPFFIDTEADYRASIYENNYLLVSNKDSVRTSYYLNGVNYQLERLHLEDLSEQREVIGQLADYQKIEKIGDFSHLRTVEIQGEGVPKVTLTLDYSKVKFDEPLTMPFSIPGSYKRDQRMK